MNRFLEVPQQFRANHSVLSQKIGRFFLRITGWNIKGAFPDGNRIILVAGPHTSNWDFALALSMIFGLNLNVHWVGKHTLFKNGLSKLIDEDILLIMVEFNYFFLCVHIIYKYK